MLHAAGVGANFIRQVLGQVEHVGQEEQLLVKAGQFLCRGHKRNVLVAREGQRQEFRLERISELPFCLQAAVYDIVAADLGIAGVHDQLPGDAFDQRCFPRSVGTDEAHKVSAIHGEVHVVQDGVFPDGFAQAPDRERRGRRVGRGGSGRFSTIHSGSRPREIF